MSIQELLKQLDSFWNISADPRYKGEHPDCGRIQDELLAELRKLTDDELLELLTPMSDEQLNQIAIVLETISDVGEKEWLKAYVKF
jgi:hypothetical protein